MVQYAGPSERYRVERALGEGAAGMVYLAEDTSLGRQVVVKLLKVDFGHGKALERFQREVQIMAHHPHEAILPLLDANFKASPPYMVTPWMVGGTLAARMQDEGALPLRELVPLGARMAEALEHLHVNEVLHRDLKPENILLDDRGQAVLADMGLSRIRDASRLTMTGYVVGTPLYLSREVIMEGEYSPQSDLFALGGILLEATTGRRLSDLSSKHEVTQAHLREVDHPELRKVLRWCLRTDPGERPGRGSLLAEALRDLLPRTGPVDRGSLSGSGGLSEDQATEEISLEGAETTEFDLDVVAASGPGPAVGPPPAENSLAGKASIPGFGSQGSVLESQPVPASAMGPERKPRSFWNRARVRKLFSGVTALLLMGGCGVLARVLFERYLFPPLPLDPVPPLSSSPGDRLWRPLPAFEFDEQKLRATGLVAGDSLLRRDRSGTLRVTSVPGPGEEQGWSLEFPASVEGGSRPVAFAGDERGGYLAVVLEASRGERRRVGFLWGPRGELLRSWSEDPLPGSRGELTLRPLALLPQALLVFADGALLRVDREPGGRIQRYRIPWNPALEVHVDEWLVAIRQGPGEEIRFQ